MSSTSKDRGRYVTAQRLEIEELWNQGCTLGEIAARMNSTVNSISTTIAYMRHAPDLWDVPHRYDMSSQ